MIEDMVVLLLVAAAAVYTVVRLRRVAAGQSKCVCGSKGCGAASTPCGAGLKGGAGVDVAGGGLPMLPPSCGQGGCGKR